MQKRIITYYEYGNLLNKLVELLKSVNIDCVYGIPRGGLPIAVHLSHHLDISIANCELIAWDFYRDKKLLIVDDILDTGKTIQDTIELCKNHTTISCVATLFKRPNITGTDVFIEETPEWLVFPYETYDEEPSDYHQDVYPELMRSELHRNA